MRALLLDGRQADDAFTREIAGRLVDLLNEANWEVELIELHGENIAGCRGCFGCWIRTPGMCIIDDRSREITKKMVRSQLTIYLTPVTFGGYSYHLKKVVDRFIPTISPFFEKTGGEVHHAKRYDSSPSLGAIGVTEGESEEEGRIFRRLVHRNAVNMHSPSHSSVLIPRNCPRGSCEESLRNMLAELGVT